MNNKCKNLFLECRDFSDTPEFMNIFCTYVKEFNNFLGGDIRLKFIHPKDEFPIETMFIIYDDCTGAMNPTVYHPLDFIELMIENYEEYDNSENDIEFFWESKLENLIKEFDY